MGDKTKIEWSEATWNPVRGCSIVSEGCRHCYAMRQAHRMNHPGGAYEGLTKMTASGPKWTGHVRTIPELLDRPLRWRKPRRIFVNSMSDLFHPDVPDDFISAVFGAMARAPHHVFQVLTKRPERMRSFLCDTPHRGWLAHVLAALAVEYPPSMQKPLDARESMEIMECGWPLPNVWLGVSCEDQATADERIPRLLATPAVVRFVSCEPLLGPIDLTGTALGWRGARGVLCDDWSEKGRFENLHDSGLGWVIVGGESGPGARPCDVQWIRSIVEQCQEADVPVFVKQLGASWYEQLALIEPRDRKGGDPSEWPDDLRIREYPTSHPISNDQLILTSAPDRGRDHGG